MSEESIFVGCKCVLREARQWKGCHPQMRMCIGHFMSFHLQTDKTVLISDVSWEMWLSKQTLTTMTCPAATESKKINKNNNNTKDPAWLPVCCRVMITIWTAAIQFWQKWELFRVCGQTMSIGFLVCSCAALMLDWQSALGFAAKSQERWMRIPFCVFWDSLATVVRFTTGASQQLVMTQYPQSLKLFLLQMCRCLPS